jgi:hypothetical protein
MQISILNGIYTDNGPDFRTSYPVNMVPVPKNSGISTGYLRPGDGLVANGTGPGTDRGGINWNGDCYRVMGTKLVKIDSAGTVTVLGDVGGPVTELVTMDYSFDVLAIASGGRLYYWIPVNTTATLPWNPTAPILRQVTDPDLGVVLDVVWVDGFFMTTDGEFLVVTELLDPMSVNPFKYGTSEVDPDPVVALLKLRNEVYALNRNTIEVFDNTGGELFPFARIDGAQIQKGVVGTFACCVYIERIAFLGSGRNESPGIYVGAAATTQKISTQEIDELLLTYTEAQLSLVKLEARNDKSHQHLYVHLPDRTIVYDAAASEALGDQVWFTLTTTVVGFAQYRARNLVWAYDKWLVGDPQSSTIGYLVDDIGSHWGQQVRWEFGTIIAYNEGKGALFQKIELVSLTGRVALGTNPQISTSYSLDGLSYSQDRYIYVGTIGNTSKRLAWFQQGHMRNWRIQRFRGDSDSHIAFARLEMQIEGLLY